MRNRTWIFPSLLVAALGPSILPGADRPDLSGVYDIATVTPLVRPENLGDRRSLTDAEAKALAQSTAEAIAKKNEASDPNRPAPPAGASVGNYNNLWMDSGTGGFRIDGQWRTSIIIDPPNGRMPAMTPEASKRAAERTRLSRPDRGDAWWIAEGISPGPYDDPELRPIAERCLLAFGGSAGPPALPVAYNNLKQIVQTKDHVMIFNEMVHDVRIVRLNSKHEPPEIRRWLGDSIGHWEGDTLVVDTTNFNDRPALANATRNLHVVERFTRVDAKTLRYKFTVEDRTVWTKPWTGELVWPATDARIYEYACHEGNYSFGGILRGARRLEAEAAAGKTPALPSDKTSSSSTSK